MHPARLPQGSTARGLQLTGGACATGGDSGDTGGIWFLRCLWASRATTPAATFVARGAYPGDGWNEASLGLSTTTTDSITTGLLTTSLPALATPNIVTAGRSAAKLTYDPEELVEELGKSEHTWQTGQSDYFWLFGSWCCLFHATRRCVTAHLAALSTKLQAPSCVDPLARPVPLSGPGPVLCQCRSTQSMSSMWDSGRSWCANAAVVPWTECRTELRTKRGAVSPGPWAAPWAARCWPVQC